MLHSFSGHGPEYVGLEENTGGVKPAAPVRGPVAAEPITQANINAATLILHRCFRDKISKREIDECLRVHLQGEHHVPANPKMNLPGFEILDMFIFRNSIKQPVAVGGLRRTQGRNAADVSFLWLGVAPEHRRKGYGIAMLAQLERLAIERYAAKWVSLCTDYEWEGSAPARAMYEKYGFQVEYTFPIFWGKEECMQVWYMKAAG